jgi:hypothetical protein
MLWACAARRRAFLSSVGSSRKHLGGLYTSLRERYVRRHADRYSTLAPGHVSLRNKDLCPRWSNAQPETRELAIKDDMIATAGDLSINKSLGKTLGHRHLNGRNLVKVKGSSSI